MKIPPHKFAFMHFRRYGAYVIASMICGATTVIFNSLVCHMAKIVASVAKNKFENTPQPIILSLVWLRRHLVVKFETTNFFFILTH